MNEIIESKCKLLAENLHTLKKAFKSERDVLNLGVAGMYMLLGLEPNIERIEDCYKFLKSKEGCFSDFRSAAMLPLICKMALSQHPSEYFETVREVYDYFHHKKLFSSEYKMLAAMIIADRASGKEAEKLADKTIDFFNEMNDEHPFLTGEDDYPFAATLAVSECNLKAATKETENCYKQLKKQFGANNPVQTLSQVLALSQQDADNKCAKVIEIYDALKEKKHKVRKSYTLTSLGFLAMIDRQAEELADMVCVADECLKDQKGFGFFSGIDKDDRLLFASICVISAYQFETTAVSTLMLLATLASAKQQADDETFTAINTMNM